MATLAWSAYSKRVYHGGRIQEENTETIPLAVAQDHPYLLNSACGVARLCAKRGRACLVSERSEPRNRMRETFTYGSVGGAAGKPAASTRKRTEPPNPVWPLLGCASREITSSAR
jgi:hypothetical protein